MTAADYDISFPPTPASAEGEALRLEVRTFLAEALKGRTAVERAESWNGYDAAFSRDLGRRGWLGMTWPKQYGGQEKSALERYVVVEELLAAGAPVNAHWIAERQSGPSILKYGTEQQKREIVPAIARGECFFCIGMSEPDSGSDLAAARTKAVETADGWEVNGTKLWTSGAHHAHYMILFCKTGRAGGDTDGAEGDRHGGASQFIVDLKAPGITISPVLALTGEHHFNEVHFDNVRLPKDALLGRRGDGWAQVMSELAFERSGPERFLSSFQVLVELTRRTTQNNDGGLTTPAAIGRIAARTAVLRRMSRSVAGMLQDGRDPSLQAAMVKDIGAVLEQDIPEIARLAAAGGVAPSLQAEDGLDAALAYTIQHAPSFSIRGGTREILRGIIARGLGLR
jgi:alkylation response protein AidB-like acyl-CoA dehydrogenase